MPLANLTSIPITPHIAPSATSKLNKRPPPIKVEWPPDTSPSRDKSASQRRICKESISQPVLLPELTSFPMTPYIHSSTTPRFDDDHPSPSIKSGLPPGSSPNPKEPEHQRHIRKEFISQPVLLPDLTSVPMTPHINKFDNHPPPINVEPPPRSSTSQDKPQQHRRIKKEAISQPTLLPELTSFPVTPRIPSQIDIHPPPIEVDLPFVKPLTIRRPPRTPTTPKTAPAHTPAHVDVPDAVPHPQRHPTPHTPHQTRSPTIHNLADVCPPAALGGSEWYDLLDDVFDEEETRLIPLNAPTDVTPDDHMYGSFPGHLSMNSEWDEKTGAGNPIFLFCSEDGQIDDKASGHNHKRVATYDIISLPKSFSNAKRQRREAVAHAALAPGFSPDVENPYLTARSPLAALAERMSDEELVLMARYLRLAHELLHI